MPQILIGKIKRIVGMFLDWLKKFNLSGLTHIYKQSRVHLLVKYNNANCCKSATFLFEICKTTFELNMAAQLHVANYISSKRRKSNDQNSHEFRLKSEKGWQILRLHFKPSIPTSSRSSCLDSKRIPNLSSN